ncbi:MAG TPA: hypothetical protein PLT82_07725 [Candidatus Hydrogenedens sp.]|nr:hypothetical protein [Candidatus Hydrogenedens sp.]HOK09465.1 hypothetical protein [Candidatus Hydrogenedens sp.]HOL18944.1 hypothetical protein [Candidatus Hydrogenedens sp.]HPP59004.1 hypothetical protein [Candidatus Hydrogenedens sp.]
MKHIKKQTYKTPQPAVTADVILILVIQLLEAIRNLVSTKATISTNITNTT